MTDASGVSRDPERADALERRLDELEAENDRLRAALEDQESSGLASDSSLSDAFTRLWNRLARGE